MDKSHKRFLLKYRLEFTKDLEANDITGYLYQEQVITENDRDMIDSKKTRRDRVEFLMDLLPRKGPKALGKFHDILTLFPSYKYLARLIAEHANLGRGIALFFLFLNTVVDFDGFVYCLAD